MLREESPAFSLFVAGNLGFLSSYDGDLRDPLVCLRKVNYPRELPGASWDSSPLGAGS